ncbi:small membrane protein [Streptomyces sp. SPB78]|uniref:hypothetical protein n=1 Tax=Streptomyces sp. (strain SPB78) TaxID=591157 RepID=UPI0001B55942|nr:hypothetical protein [Streptomyces sp. SPB78]EFL00827.1 small membrane protein [Streptomyces sp. SPB78]
MNYTARRIGRTLALVLPVVLVLSGTLAVTHVSWTTQGSSDSTLTASASDASSPAGTDAKNKRRAPEEVLRTKLLSELQEKDPGIALTHLQQAIHERPSLAKHCVSLARSLGEAAVRAYGPNRAQSFARPVCDTAYATGVATMQG